MPDRLSFFGALTISTAALVAIPASASTLLSVTGTPSSVSSGLGNAGTPGDDEAGAVEFTTSGLTNVTISVDLDGVGSTSQTIYAWVTNKIGAGTTNTNVLASSTFAGPASSSAVESAFTNLTLAAGTYYLVLSALDAQNLTGWHFTKSPVELGAPGNIYDGSWGNSDVSAPFAPPGVVSEVSTSPNDANFLFSITTTATPLPSTWTMLIVGFAALGFFVYRGSKNNTAAVAAA
jgi:hypothetical protein